MGAAPCTLSHIPVQNLAMKAVASAQRPSLPELTQAVHAWPSTFIEQLVWHDWSMYAAFVTHSPRSAQWVH